MSLFRNLHYCVCGFAQLCRAALVFVLVGASLPGQQQSPARDPLNRQLPRWLTLGTDDRLRLEGPHGIGYDPQQDDGFLASRLRLRVGIQPNRSFRVFFEGQDSRVAGAEPFSNPASMTNHFDLRQAYFAVGDEKEGWWDVTVGRQELVFGTERLIGVNQWSNVSRSYDAAKVAIHHNGNRVDIFAASVVAVDPTHTDHHRDGQNVDGIYASLGRFIPDVVFEPHIFYRTRPLVTDERGMRGDSDVYTTGLRLASKAKWRWDFQTEMDWQFGTYATDDLRAFMGLWGVGYKPPRLSWQPRLLAEYTYASGDSQRGDGKIETFDQLYARAHRIWGIADQIGGRNAKMLLTGIHVRPAPKTMLRFDHHFFWLASKNDGLYRNNGALSVAAPPGGAASAYVGHEVDLQLSYDFSANLSFGTGVAHLFAGPFLKETTPGGSFTYPYVYLEFEL